MCRGWDPSVPDRLWTADVMLLATRVAAQSRSILLALEWAVALVLLIACANIANLLLAVSAGRRKELAVRQALGASHWQIARDLAGETLILSVAGGTLAILLATWIVAVLNATVSFQDVNSFEPFRLDGAVLAFTGGLTFAVASVFSLVPARTAANADVVETLKASTHGVTAGVSNSRLRHALIVGELALSIVLTASASARRFAKMIERARRLAVRGRCLRHDLDAAVRRVMVGGVVSPQGTFRATAA